MNEFRNNIVNNAINKLNKKDTEINSKNTNYLNILDSFITSGSSNTDANNHNKFKDENNIKKINYYINELKTQETYFGGSLKFNNKVNIKTYKDKENELTNILICLDEDYKDSLFCERTNDFKSLNYYRKKLVLIFEFLGILKNNNIKDPIFKYLLNEKDKKYKNPDTYSYYTKNLMNSSPIGAKDIYVWEEYINKYNFDKIYHDNDLIYSTNYFFMDNIIHTCNVNKYNNNIHILQPLKIFLNSKNVIDNKIVLELINSDKYLFNDSKIDVNLKTKEQKICSKEIINSFDLNQNFDKLKSNIKLISINYIFFKDILNDLDNNSDNKNKKENITNIFKLKMKIKNDLENMPKIKENISNSNIDKDSTRKINDYLDPLKPVYIDSINLIKNKINKYRINDENKYLINKINNYEKILNSFIDYINNDNFNLIDFNTKISLFTTKLYTNYTNFSSNFKVQYSLIETIKTMCKLDVKQPLVKIPTFESNKYNIANYFNDTNVANNIINNKYSLLPIYIYIQNSSNTSFINTNHIVMLIKNNKLEYNYNTDKTDKVIDNLECTLFLLKGDGKYEILEKENYKLFETNLFYDYHFMQESKDIKNNELSFYLINSLLSNFKKNPIFAGMNINIQNSYVSNNRIINFHKLRNFFDEKLYDKSNIKISENNLSKINLIKTDYFYLENFYECLFTILNTTEKNILTNFYSSDKLKSNIYLDFKTYINDYLIKNGILDNFDIEKKINKLKSKDVSNLEVNINKYILKYFNENKDYYKKYIDLLKSISIYSNGFVNKLNIKDINSITGRDFANHSYLFKSKLYFNFIINNLNNDKNNTKIDEIINKNYMQIIN